MYPTFVAWTLPTGLMRRTPLPSSSWTGSAPPSLRSTICVCLYVQPLNISQRPRYQDLLQVHGSWVSSRWYLLWPSMGLGGPESGTSEQGPRTSRNIFPKKLSRQDWRIQSKITLFVFLRYLTLHNGGVALAQAHGTSLVIFVLQLVPPLLTAIHPIVSW